MPVLINDPVMAEHILAERQASEADRYDEVWEGVYVMPPMPNDEHQQLVMGLSYILQDVLGLGGPDVVRLGINVSDREDNWQENYRIPDVAVILAGGRARNLGTHWVGGPDFMVEIISPNDNTRDKLPFYSGIGVRELLLIDREPWLLELYRLEQDRLVLCGRSSLDDPAALESQVVPLNFRLLPAQPRQLIEVVHREQKRRWAV